uniref:Lysophosphatidylcholine acyltransferase 1 n=2 Tax=Lygus hesperus TaxID=30085 RepID=A0A0A9W937_LYGHE
MKTCNVDDDQDFFQDNSLDVEDDEETPSTGIGDARTEPPDPQEGDESGSSISRMKKKCTATEDILKGSSELINPFVHHLELTTTYEKLKAAILSVIVLPLRIGIIASLLVLAWCVALLGMWGITEEEFANKPLEGWRKKIKFLICNLVRLTYRAGGMSVKTIGKQASRSEAPILVGAPHSTFLDGVVVYHTNFPCILVRKESGSNIWLGMIMNYHQPLYVRRDNPESRHKSIQAIIDRAKSPLDWSQILIFPEGTTTNRSCLISFKPGAFYPGLPIQPMIIRYPNKMDTVTWTWDGPGALKILWQTLLQPHTFVEIEFLPVYNPSEDERRDPKLYAQNVRRLMAKELGIPTLDYTYQDCQLVSKAKKLSYSKDSIMLQAHQLRVQLGLSRTEIELKMIAESPKLLVGPGIPVSFSQFATLLNLNQMDPGAKELFSLFQKGGVLDLKEYIMCVILVSSCSTKSEMIKKAFQVCGGDMSSYDFVILLRLILGVDDRTSKVIFREITPSNRHKRITYDMFEDYARTKAEFAPYVGRRDRPAIEMKFEAKKVK